MDELEKWVEKFAQTIVEILKASGGTNIDAQIKIIELLNNKLLHAPIFTAIIQSLRELRSIKRKQFKK